MYIRCILCLFFLFFAVVEDVQYRRIPNEVVLCGAAAGFLTCGSLYTFLWRILALLFLFCLGYFRIMGMGDLKLWMMITTFTGLRNSCFIMAFAAIFLCIYAFFKNREEAMLIFKNMHFSFMTKKKPIIMEQTGYAFSPFMLAATVFFYLAVFL